MPQGNLAERLRAAGAGIGPAFTPTVTAPNSRSTPTVAQGNPRNQRLGQYVLSTPSHGDVALIKAEKGDRWGNLTYRMSVCNFGPVMATAAATTIATARWWSWRS